MSNQAGQQAASNILPTANVVKVGISIQSFGPPDTATETFPATFDLWLVTPNPFDVSNLIFVDAATPIRLGQPLTTHTVGDRNYRLYHVAGTFRYRPSVGGIFTNRLTLHIGLRSANATRTQLVLSPDLAGSQLGASATGDGSWKVLSAQLREVAIDEATLGDPAFATSQASHSEIVAAFSVARRSNVIGGLRHIVPPALAVPIAIAMLVLIGGAVFSGRGTPSPEPYWFIACLGSITLLLAAVESFLGAHASAVFGLSQARVARTVIDGMWLALIAAWLIGLLPLLVWGPLERRTGTPPSTLERVGVNVVIVLALGLTFLSSALNLSATSIGATSGVLTLILGFALQNIILDLFSGVLLNIEKPFRLLNWITVETGGAGVFGQVRNMNWRTTQLQTRDNNLVSIPNSVVAKSSVLNHANPSAFSRAKLEFVLSPKVPTAMARQVMKEGALRSAESGLILGHPAPSVVVTGIEDYGVRYRVFFYVNLNIGSDSSTLSSVAENVLAALTEAGIALALRYDISVPQAGEEPLLPRELHPMPKTAGAAQPSARPAMAAPVYSSPLNAAEIELVRASWPNDHETREELAALFYNRLFTVAPQVRPLFRSDAKVQRTKFVAMLAVLVKAANQLETLRDTLAEFGVRHQTYGAEPAHFAVVGDVLLWTLQQKLGNAFDERTQAAWGKLYGAVADMIMGVEHEAA